MQIHCTLLLVTKERFTKIFSLISMFNAADSLDEFCLHLTYKQNRMRRRIWGNILTPYACAVVTCNTYDASMKIQSRNSVTIWQKGSKRDIKLQYKSLNFTMFRIIPAYKIAWNVTFRYFPFGQVTWKTRPTAPKLVFPSQKVSNFVFARPF